ncbi:MAG: iron uptake system protein EfeO [Acidobacteria bacterium]|nr:MAG: iron uptake system protein EfeO [Acidobacteriota bacterium]
MPDPRIPSIARPMTAIAAVATLAALATACGSSSDGTDSDAQRVAVTITDDGCDPTDLEATAGPATFEVENVDSAINNEFEVLDGALILGERENVTPGLSGEVSVNLDPGTYDIVCGNPGNREPTGKLVVSGERQAATTDPRLREAADEYAEWVDGEAEELVRRTGAFVAAIEAGDVGEAKELYEHTRIPYERIEPVAESFGGLDPAIDARINDIAQGDEWTGFHPLEKALWIDGRIGEREKATARRLMTDVERLRRLTAENTYDPVQLANGAVELLNEVSLTKITGEEERYSHTDLTDFKANIDGAREAFVLLAPALREIDPDLATEIEERFADMYAALRPYRVEGNLYENYEKVGERERQELSQAVDALALPLARLGGQVVGQ